MVYSVTGNKAVITGQYGIYDNKVKSASVKYGRNAADNYKIYAEMDSNENIYSMKFISKDDRRANRELNDAISYYLWLTSNYFLYSKSGKGIYLYNLEDGIVTRIAEGSKEFELKGYENGFIKYDNEEIEFQY